MELLIRPKAWEELEKKVMSILSQTPEVHQVGCKTENLDMIESYNDRMAAAKTLHDLAYSRGGSPDTQREVGKR